VGAGGGEVDVWLGVGGAVAAAAIACCDADGDAQCGGVLKLEPREADQLPVPAPAVVLAARAGLQACRPAVRDALRRGNLLHAVALVDRVLLRAQLQLSEDQHGELVAARALLAARRVARGATRLVPP